MSESQDPSMCDTEILMDSVAHDLAAAGGAETELDRYRWLKAAMATQWELARREGERK